jgi:hypothetical protein
MCSGQNGNSRVVTALADRKRARLAAAAPAPATNTASTQGLIRERSVYGSMARKTGTP